MKYAYLLLVASMGMLAACSGLNEIDPEKNALPEEGELVERVIFEVPAIHYQGEDVETRASLSQEQEGNEDILFGWEATDTVGIYPNQGAQVYFSMKNGVGTNVASFDGGGWALRENSTYSCYYPFVGSIYLDRNAIPVSFAGQEFSPAEQIQASEQDQTSEQASLPKYNGTRFYLASEGTSSSSGALRFTFQMLNTVLRIKASGLPAGTYTKLSLSTDEPSFVQKGSFGLESMEITGKTYSNSLEVSLKDFTLTEASSTENPALIYLTSAPVDLRGKTLTVKIYSSDGSAYICEKHPGVPYEANSWVGITCNMAKESAIIYYTSSNNEAVTPTTTEAFGGATIVSNTYVGSKGIMVFDNDVTVIGDNAFEYCTTLTGITMPGTVTMIGNYAFSGCTNLAADNTSADMTQMMRPMMLSLRSGESSFVIPGSVTSIGEGAFQGCTSLSSISIPSTVTNLSKNVFSGSGLTFVTIPDGVTSIGEDAFAACPNLVSVTIPDSVTSIGEGAFQDCPNLSSISIPSTVTDISENVFSGSGLTAVTIPEGVTCIEDGAFAECSHLVRVTIPNSVTSIGEGAFEACFNLSDITIPDSLRSIGHSAFMSCTSLTNFSIPSNVTEINDFTFSNCASLASVSIPDGMESIGADAFSYCRSLTGITIPNSVTTIGNRAFAESGLTSLIIPKYVTSIGNFAFIECNDLTHLTIHATNPPTLGMWNGINNTFKPAEGMDGYLIYVPSESLEAYKTADGWSNYADRICDRVYVDMGNGMKWATTNVGAIGPDDLGQYFAWGRTTPIVSVVEDYDYDAPFIDTAHAIWGGNWRMPTAEEWSGLMQEISYTWIWDSNRKGYNVKSLETGNTIFLPAAGNVGEHGIGSVGFEGDYWSSALFDFEPHDAVSLSLDQYNGVSIGGWGRSAGLSVRPVYQSEPLGDMETLIDSGKEVEL